MINKYAALLFAGIAAATMAPLSAHACGGFWDVACNVGKTIEKAGQDIGNDIKRNPDHYIQPGVIGLCLATGATCAVDF